MLRMQTSLKWESKKRTVFGEGEKLGLCYCACGNIVGSYFTWRLRYAASETTSYKFPKRHYAITFQSCRSVLRPLMTTEFASLPIRVWCPRWFHTKLPSCHQFVIFWSTPQGLFRFLLYQTKPATYFQDLDSNWADGVCHKAPSPHRKGRYKQHLQPISNALDFWEPPELVIDFGCVLKMSTTLVRTNSRTHVFLWCVQIHSKQMVRPFSSMGCQSRISLKYPTMARLY